MTPDELLDAGAAELGLKLDVQTRQRLLAYVDLLLSWNRTHNLTAVRDPEQIVSRHLLDSLSVLPYVPQGRVVDVGSGAGLPGIPLALARPDSAVTLLDSSQKKTAFMRHACTQLGIVNADVVRARAESWKPPAPFDAAICRALGGLGVFAEQSAALIGEAGCLLAMKGLHPYEELAELPETVTLEKVVELHVPFLQANRRLVIMRRKASELSSTEH
ncbi:MAG: 16S rRNA (guanine(527)-N(7))-methyltransferase RsmG [Burkholderiales bacterium]